MLCSPRGGTTCFVVKHSLLSSSEVWLYHVIFKNLLKRPFFWECLAFTNIQYALLAFTMYVSSTTTYLVLHILCCQFLSDVSFVSCFLCSLNVIYSVHVAWPVIFYYSWCTLDSPMFFFFQLHVKETLFSATVTCVSITPLCAMEYRTVSIHGMKMAAKVTFPTCVIKTLLKRWCPRWTEHILDIIRGLYFWYISCHLTSHGLLLFFCLRNVFN